MKEPKGIPFFNNVDDALAYMARKEKKEKRIIKVNTWFSVHYRNDEEQRSHCILVNEFEGAKRLYTEIHEKLKKEAKRFYSQLDLTQTKIYDDGFGEPEKIFRIVEHTERGAGYTETAKGNLRQQLLKKGIILDKQGIEEGVPQGQPLFRDYSPGSRWVPWEVFKEERDRKEAMYNDTGRW